VVVYALPSETPFSNIGGCIAALEPLEASCGQTLQAELQCLVAHCSQCSIPFSAVGSERSAALGRLNGCFAVAQNKGCASEARAAATCLGAVTGRSAIARDTCALMNRNLDSFLQAVSFMCGYGAVDDIDAGATVPDASADAMPPGDGDAGIDAGPG